jgi:hypothetical protein
MRPILLNIQVQNILLFILLSKFFHCHISHPILVYLCIMEILIVIGHRILVALLNLCLVLSFFMHYVRCFCNRNISYDSHIDCMSASEAFYGILSCFASFFQIYITNSLHVEYHMRSLNAVTFKTLKFCIL